MPSHTYWHFLFDSAISFFGILAVLSVGTIQNWALLGALAMVSSVIRCALSWREAKAVKSKLNRTLFGAAAMLVLMLAVYYLALLVEQTMLASAAFVLVLLFVIYSSIKP